ncbi:MAG: hypothetical protein GF388_09485, partial [Candidatus Aegiribacteria sp.]|nr:hypothetical protein [Candidatus Aegiribacteria sp.]
MKNLQIISVNALVCLSLLFSIASAGEPTQIPWPIGYSEAEMHYSRDLFKTYGNWNGTWSNGGFHPGIDIFINTDIDGCDEVRCVKAGYVTWISEYTVPGSDVDDYTVVICDEMSGSADYGWCYQHMVEPSWQFNDYVPYSALIATMHPGNINPHLHFMWTEDTYQYPYLGYVNPLNYLDPAATEGEGFTWTWNPEANDPPYEYFFLPYMYYEDWSALSVSETFEEMLDPFNLSGHVDLFLGQYLSGTGMASGLEQAPWLTPRRIKWAVVKESPSGEEIVHTRYVMDFDCVLAGLGDIRYKMHFFSNYMNEMYGGGEDHFGSLECLTNCGDADGWTNLGIDNICNSSWKTNINCEDNDDTENPVIAAFRDGPYRIDVESYTYDLTDMYPISIDVELHNFDPVVEKVILSSEDNTVWEAYWTADGLTPVLNNPVDAGVLPDQQLDVTVVFSEPMDT